MVTTERHGAAGRRRHRRGVAVGAALLALLAGATACGGTSAEVEVKAIDDRTPAAILATAADSASTVESGRMRASVDYRFELPGGPTQAALTMSGAFTDQGRRSEITADMGAYVRGIADRMGSPLREVPGSMVMRLVQDGTDMYMKFDVDPPEPGTEYWYLTDLAATGMDVSQMENPAGLGGGPTSYIDSLRGAGADVAETGTETINGITTTRLEGTIDPSAAIDRAAPEKRAEVRSMLRASGMTEPMPFVAWVGDDGVLRRLQMTMSMGMGGISMTATTTVEYYDFGADVTVTTPPAQLVRDASELTGGTA